MPSVDDRGLTIGPHSVAQIAELQERAARAVPAAAQARRNGCWLRHTDSTIMWWAGATLMHGRAPVRDLVSSIAAAEDFYAAHGERARFQVCPACPPDLDSALAHRGYEWGDAVSLQVAASEHVAHHPPAPSLRVDVNDEPDTAWFQLLMRAHETDADPAPEWRLIQRIDRPSAYVTAFISGRSAALGRAVADTGWAGVFDMATMPDARRRGAARAVLAALADWAVSQRCPHMYLQVQCNNPGALGLYRRAGFEESCTYHYRTASG
jgi:ribosomal protein S18 acetylase RimI-like enzyme